MSLLELGFGAAAQPAKGFEAPTLPDQIAPHLQEAESKAWDSLARYKFQMFGYWAAIWVHLNRIGGFKRPNPFCSLVQAAKSKRNL